MNENHYWDEFYMSGSILSYLSYKKCQIEKPVEEADISSAFVLEECLEQS
ncbi:MAG: hypothetical protein FWE24_00715 [Defluviitaleaceae bacterium]|nr:hypothetical protein [Defluviitaleaceae bacterium]